jgi:hypothetical protein
VIDGGFEDYDRMMNGRVVALGMLLAMAGCGGGSPSGTPVSAVRAASAMAKKGPSAQEQTAGMVEAASTGKSGVPVEVKFDLMNRPAIGQPLELDIAVLPQVDASAATVQLTSMDGLDVAAGAGEFAFLTVEADQVYHRKLSVRPNAEGVLVLGLTVTLTRDEVVESREFGIPIIVDGGRAVAANTTP